MIDRALARHYHRGGDFAVADDGVGRSPNLRFQEGAGGPGTPAERRRRRESQAGVSAAAMRRSSGFDNLLGQSGSPPAGPSELHQLERRVAQLEAPVARDEDVLRKLIAFIIDKGVCSRDEILTYLAQK
jgi:hypothetical protein